MSILSGIGVGSGLDIRGLVAQLVAAEGEPVNQQLNRQESRLEAQLSSLGTLKSALSAFETSLAKLDNAVDFRVFSASSANEALYTARADANAVAGQYGIEVLQLAQHHKLSSATFSNTESFGGRRNDRLTLTVDGESFDIDLSTAKTLGEIRDAINSAADNTGVAATLINVDESQQALVLTAKESGYGQHIEVDERIRRGPTLDLNIANQDANGDPLTNPTQLDASVSIDGIAITRSTNLIADAIDGVTLELHQAEPGTSATLSVDYDREAIATNISEFVDNYNALVQTIKDVSGYKGEGAEQPALFGDSLARGISSRLRSELGRMLSDLGGTFSSLSDLGITTQTDGTLQLDGEKLNGALGQDLDAVGQLFFSAEGYASRIDGVLSAYLGAGGILNSRTDGIQDRLDAIGDRRAALDRRSGDGRATLLEAVFGPGRPDRAANRDQ